MISSLSFLIKTEYCLCLGPDSPSFCMQWFMLSMEAVLYRECKLTDVQAEENFPRDLCNLLQGVPGGELAVFRCPLKSTENFGFAASRKALTGIQLSGVYISSISINSNCEKFGKSYRCIKIYRLLGLEGLATMNKLNKLLKRLIV